MKEAILGISAYYHDSAACIVVEGEIIAAAQEERFSRKKNDSSFPHKAIESVLQIAEINLNDLSAIAFYEKPYIKFERLLETYHSFAPKGLKNYLEAMPIWIKEKLFMKKMIWDELEKILTESRKKLFTHPLIPSQEGKLIVKDIPLLFPEHHLSHASSAFFPSPFEEAAILTVDGVGEWATSTICYGKGNSIEILKELEFPHSIGLLYSAFTYYCGFKVNDGEYKLMGLAPYGEANSQQAKKFIDLIYSELVDVREDGSILLNMNYFDFATALTMTNNKKWEKLFGISPRLPESGLTQDYANLAFAIQKVTEDILLRLAKTARELTSCNNLALAGGVALNSVANGLIYKSGLFDKIWIQPAAGDAGGALGAALAACYIYFEKERRKRKVENPNSPSPISHSPEDSMKASLLGPSYSNDEIKKLLDYYGVIYHYIVDNEELFSKAATLISEGEVLGWFRGRMEYGPRALGNRSILADARNPGMQQKLNLKIKYREGFRPFAPAVLELEAQKYFDIDVPSPYMLLVVPLKESARYHLPENFDRLNLMEKLYIKRSEIPAVTHLDYSARIQTVSQEDNPDFYGLLSAFRDKTVCPVIINTSFNVRGEPIVCTPLDAYKCFMKTEMDCLALENYLIFKSEQKLTDDEMFGRLSNTK
ncbi:MAG: carbamoyltransferase [Bacteroidetes bacterium]|nr:carbamoyltransferase [Bacteroidota bacterium]